MAVAILGCLVAAAACRDGSLAGTGSTCDEQQNCRLGYRCLEGRCTPDLTTPTDAATTPDAPAFPPDPELDASGPADLEQQPDVELPDLEQQPDGQQQPDRPLVCASGRGDCNGNPLDGCEQALDTTAHCGQCRRSCSTPHGTTACLADRCKLVTCEPRFNVVGDTCMPCTPATSAYCGRGIDGVFCALAAPDGNLFPPVIFNRGDYADRYGWSTPEHRFGTFQFPDLNGDGRSDVCARGVVGFVCGIGQEAGAPFSPATNRESGFDEEWIAEPSRWGTAQFADVNGDRRDDLCIRTATGTKCSLWTGLGFDDARLFTAGTADTEGFTVPARWATLRFPDVNGDGRADHCGRAAGGLRCGLSDGMKFAWTSWDPTNFFSDANGWGHPAHWATIRFPDVNGDGRADVCARSEEGVVCALSKSSENAFDTPTVWSPFFARGGDTNWTSSRTYFATLQFPDLDGDGRQDVCARGSGGLFCGLSTGDKFGAVTRWSEAFSDAAGWDHPEYAESIRFFDRNGDRAADVCGRSASNIQCALSDGKASFIAPSQTAGFTDAQGWGTIDKWTTFAANVVEPGTCRLPPSGEVVPLSPGFRLSF